MVDRFAQFTGAILALHRCINKIKELETAELGLRGNHVMCLYYLGQYEEGLTAAQLTTLCREDKAAISRTLNQLSEQGLVCRTPAGKALTEQINRKVEAVLACSSRGISDQQRADLYLCFQVILNNLEQYIDQKEASVPPCTSQSRKEGTDA